jgi:hypothetical protein
VGGNPPPGARLRGDKERASAVRGEKLSEPRGEIRAVLLLGGGWGELSLGSMTPVGGSLGWRWISGLSEPGYNGGDNGGRRVGRCGCGGGFGGGWGD